MSKKELHEILQVYQLLNSFSFFLFLIFQGISRYVSKCFPHPIGLGSPLLYFSGGTPHDRNSRKGLTLQGFGMGSLVINPPSRALYRPWGRPEQGPVGMEHSESLSPPHPAARSMQSSINRDYPCRLVSGARSRYLVRMVKEVALAGVWQSTTSLGFTPPCQGKQRAK